MTGARPLSVALWPGRGGTDPRRLFAVRVIRRDDGNGARNRPRYIVVRRSQRCSKTADLPSIAAAAAISALIARQVASSNARTSLQKV